MPWWQQYLTTLAAYAHGDFGYSTQYGTGVLEIIGEALPATAALAGLGFLVAALLATIIAFVSTLTPFAWLRDGLRALPGLFVSVPVFWLGILLIQVFSFGLGWVPIVGADPVQALDPPRHHARGADLGAAGTDPGSEHRRGAAPAVRDGRAGEGRRGRRGCCGTRWRATRSCPP